MKPCWYEMGLTEAGAQRADRALEVMTAAVILAGSEDLARAVLREAGFRLFDLPKRTEAFQKRYLTENTEKKKRR